MWRVLCEVAGRNVVEAFEGSVDVSVHGNIDVSIGVVPFQVEATVEVASPIGGAFVVGLDCLDEVESMRFFKILNTEIVHA